MVTFNVDEGAVDDVRVDDFSVEEEVLVETNLTEDDTVPRFRHVSAVQEYTLQVDLIPEQVP